MIRVKICGLTRVEDAIEAVRAGADALGVIFASSPRTVTPETAREIVQEIPPFVSVIGVFVDASVEWMRETALDVGLQGIQLHGTERPDVLHFLQFPAYKALSLGADIPMDDVQAYVDRSRGRAFLVDRPKTSVSDPIETHWKRAHALRGEGKMILAGGLDPSNVERALEQTSPHAVDVASGVEKEAGIKDRDAMIEFIARIRRWEQSR